MTIPFNDIKIDPKKLKTKLINKLDNIDINDIVKKIVIKEMKDILDSNYFWYEITGANICAYKYQFSKKKDGEICGKPIYRKNKDIKYGNFLCSRHLDKHEVERPRQLKDNQVQCKATTIANTQCLYSSKIDGYCVQHYKCINKTNINEIHKLIKLKNIEKNAKIAKSFEKLNVNENVDQRQDIKVNEKLENNKLQEKVENKYDFNNSNLNKLKRKNIKYYNSMINKKIKKHHQKRSFENMKLKYNSNNIYYHKIFPSQLPSIINNYNNTLNNPNILINKNNIFNKKGLIKPFFI